MKILDQVCTRLPATIAQQCETLLNQYKPQIVKLLAKELEPANVCTFLGICTQAMSAGKAISELRNKNVEIFMSIPER